MCNQFNYPPGAHFRRIEAEVREAEARLERLHQAAFLPEIEAPDLPDDRMTQGGSVSGSQAEEGLEVDDFRIVPAVRDAAVGVGPVLVILLGLGRDGAGLSELLPRFGG